MDRNSDPVKSGAFYPLARAGVVAYLPRVQLRLFVVHSGQPDRALPQGLIA